MRCVVCVPSGGEWPPGLAGRCSRATGLRQAAFRPFRHSPSHSSAWKDFFWRISSLSGTDTIDAAVVGRRRRWGPVINFSHRRLAQKLRVIRFSHLRALFIALKITPLSGYPDTWEKSQARTGTQTLTTEVNFRLCVVLVFSGLSSEYNI